ncbi:hypothetical protein [[Flexibacter] sp. ATCC 35103]|uniref:hypothetical protein n=1 Tax=[Flexibacter] sp. ATCC 35103 TaxID=1937528 RepID=UPI0009CF0C18|nr:hypothetical protein [[Flexibacter] sp. ATCC 35103]OMQ09077.1 hypothetical protein BXU01_19215 [[Flexibacter] sp. ATCC 35103]
MKTTLSLLLFLTFFNVFAQTEEQLFQYKYEMSKEYHNKPSYAFKTKKYVPEKLFITSKCKTDILEKSAGVFAQNTILSIRKKENNQVDIILDSKFPPEYNCESFGFVKLESISSNLFDSKNKKIKLSDSGFLNLGGEFKKDSNTELEYQTANKQSITVDNKDLKLKGTITYELSFLTDYVILSLDKTKVGSILDINGIKYELFEIYNNKVILKKLIKSNLENNIKLLIFNKKKELLVYEEGSRNSLIYSMACGQEYFEFISKNKDYTFEEFKKHFTFKDIINKESLYIVLEGVGDIENEFILYEPKYQVKKEFEAKLKG